ARRAAPSARARAQMSPRQPWSSVAPPGRTSNSPPTLRAETDARLATEPLHVHDPLQRDGVAAVLDVERERRLGALGERLLELVGVGLDDVDDGDLPALEPELEPDALLSHRPPARRGRRARRRDGRTRPRARAAPAAARRRSAASRRRPGARARRRRR